MESNVNYTNINRQSWNDRVEIHLKSDFYDVEAFINGKSSLNAIELNVLGDIKGKSILHLQCHFGQDSISLSQLGAQVTGIDFSENAIIAAKELAITTNTDTHFICSSVQDLPNHLQQTFDIVYTSYGVIGWLPDMNEWASIIHHFLKPSGRLVLVEFHPVVWMFDNDFNTVAYNYFKDEAIIETDKGTYADKEADVEVKSITWNHSLSEVVTALFKNQIHLKQLQEFNYSPYNCMNGMEEVETGKYQLQKFGNKLPLVYAIEAVKE